jgi:hypothetical protein
MNPSLPQTYKSCIANAVFLRIDNISLSFPKSKLLNPLLDMDEICHKSICQEFTSHWAMKTGIFLHDRSELWYLNRYVIYPRG